jgi:hypothetical protein
VAHRGRGGTPSSFRGAPEGTVAAEKRKREGDEDATGPSSVPKDGE